MIHVFVEGTPVPQGSVSVFRGRVVGVRPELRVWRDRVRAALVAKLQGDPWDCPVEVDLVFRLARPKKPRWWVPAVKPDVDKLARAVLDSLSTTKDQRGVIRDDARVVGLRAVKTYHDRPGVLVAVTRKDVP